MFLHFMCLFVVFIVMCSYPCLLSVFLSQIYMVVTSLNSFSCDHFGLISLSVIPHSQLLPTFISSCFYLLLFHTFLLTLALTFSICPLFACTKSNIITLACVFLYLLVSLSYMCLRTSFSFFSLALLRRFVSQYACLLLF